MYTTAGHVTARGVGGSTTLACTGLDHVALAVAAVALVVAGLALLELVPPRPR
ncbi:hypothetical protein [Geodermatophilus marinus]|uniref:hypothetical protein n=1 Tax=Geodermatophilus sp. LHW52908 TaxID=2303986 RepID=UPI001314E249|nr:hypothetical protein [Geodermatophilus sp. LHW52908]